MSIFRKILKPFKNSCNIFNKTENVGNDTEVDCEVNICKNSGQCITRWEENKQICNCEKTSFTGQTCELSI